MKGLTHHALSSMVWTGGGVVAETVLQMGVVIILTRLLAPADFGVVTVALVITGFAGLFGELGLSPALIQREALRPIHIRSAFTVSLAFALAIATALWGLSPFIASLFGMPAVTPMIRVMAMSLIVRAWGSVPAALLQRKMRFRYVSFFNVLSYLVGFGVVGVTMAATGFGAWSLIAGHVVQGFVQSLLCHVACPVSHRLGLNRRALRQLLSYGAGISFARFANYLAVRGDNIVVGHALGPTALGLYGPVYHLMAMPAELFQRIVQTVLFPTIARLQTEPDRLASVYRRGLSVTGLTALPLTALTILLAPEIVSTLLGSKWSAAVSPLQILAAGMFFRVGYKTTVVFVKAVGAVRQFAFRQIPYPLLVLSLAWLGTRWGLEGVAVGVVTALGVHYALLTALGLRIAHLTMREYLTAHGPALVLTGAVLAQAWAATTTARGLHAPPFATLVIVGASTLLATAGMIRWIPGHVLGDEGIWFHRSLTAFLARFRDRATAVGTAFTPDHATTHQPSVVKPHRP